MLLSHSALLLLSNRWDLKSNQTYRQIEIEGHRADSVLNKHDRRDDRCMWILLLEKCCILKWKGKKLFDLYRNFIRNFFYQNQNLTLHVRPSLCLTIIRFLIMFSYNICAVTNLLWHRSIQNLIDQKFDCYCAIKYNGCRFMKL